MDASTITSLGTCRLVMPLSLSTIAIAGPAASVALTSASIAARSASGSAATLATRSPKPLFGSTPRRASVAACLSKTGLKKARTAWPKMIGSETFIIVAFRWMLHRAPVARASATSRSRNETSAARLMKVASRMSPAFSLMPSLRTVTAPSAAANSMRAVVAAGIVTDFSLPKKSPAAIEATCALQSAVQAPILCGLALA